MEAKTPLPGHRFSVAPMMDWSDRHCRFFHRQMTKRALLYTEMVTVQAIRHGDRERLIGFDPREQPVALQIGGSDPKLLAEAARWGEDFGYAEINLNVGCPSDRVQEGRFGACLMAEPDLVAEGVAAMRSAVAVPVTVKCRIGIDDQDEDEDLDRFIRKVAETGCSTFIIHARKAWLEGLSPKENREIPPLNYERVYRIKEAHPELTVVVNGGIGSLAEASTHLAHVDGVMLGRAAYHTPWILCDVDRLIFGDAPAVLSRADVVARMKPYIASELEKAPGLARITRHMLGLFHGEPGGRAWRRIISENSHRPGAGADLLDVALAAVAEQVNRLQAAE
ncbi:tRNA dihydrouridine(20/20a) synthase DusA [Taklimakanibacter deserti]|uniref:tRNA dihydrouridine(20/20a) synthase DusA n=1 Tax=Taklimakanibacter deserti TaxID=2267839 RepID=UPI000E65049B